MSKWVVDIHGDIEGDYEIIEKYEEPKTGHWVRDTITDLYHCSNCRSICHQDPKSKDDYCKYCGAKMVESQESEDKE